MDKLEEFESALDQLGKILESIKEQHEKGEQPDPCDLCDIPFRVIHFIDNPADQLIKAKELEYEEAKQENERLYARLTLLESGNNADITRRIDEAVDNAHQIEILTQKVTEYKNREEKILSSLRKTASAFRMACYSLIGYRIDALEDHVYRLSHRDAGNDDERLFFKFEKDGTVKLIENDFSKRFSGYANTYLHGGDSVPAFLAAIALDYFKSSTQLVDLSMEMSTIFKR